MEMTRFFNLYFLFSIVYNAHTADQINPTEAKYFDRMTTSPQLSRQVFPTNPLCAVFNLNYCRSNISKLFDSMSS